jgi:protoheme IX farnesyltransferase
MVLGGKGLPSPGAALVCLSCILMAASGSAVVNGLLDAGRDMRMRRLDARVSALEKVGRKEALALSLIFIAGSLALSWRFLNTAATFLLLGAVASYTVLYTLYLKRRSPTGQSPGGFPGRSPSSSGTPPSSRASGRTEFSFSC